MADTIPNIPLPANTYIDLYDALEQMGFGMPVGTRLYVQNLGRDQIRLFTKNVEPDDQDGYVILERNLQASNEIGDSGAWAYSLRVDGLINVRV